MLVFTLTLDLSEIVQKVISPVLPLDLALMLLTIEQEGLLCESVEERFEFERHAETFELSMRYVGAGFEALELGKISQLCRSDLCALANPPEHLGA